MPARPGAGRKKVPIDLEQLEKLAMLYCTREEIAAWFGVTKRTIEMRERNPVFREVIERGYGKARISLRRQQIAAAERGNPTMLIWLGKQYLGQKDQHRLEHSGADGGPINENITVEFVNWQGPATRVDGKANGHAD